MSELGLGCGKDCRSSFQEMLEPFRRMPTNTESLSCRAIPPLVVSKFIHHNQKMQNNPFQRPVGKLLADRLAEAPERIQILVGPRQVGKATLVEQILNRSVRPVHSRFLLAAEPSPIGVDSISDWSRPVDIRADWLVAQWARAEDGAKAWDESDHPNVKTTPFVLAIDEIQRLPQWSPRWSKASGTTP
jgi:hypothetical protein